MAPAAVTAITIPDTGDWVLTRLAHCLSDGCDDVRHTKARLYAQPGVE